MAYPGAVKAAEYIRVCVDDDVDAARRALARAALGYALGPRGSTARDRRMGYRAHFERIGIRRYARKARRHAGSRRGARRGGRRDACRRAATCRLLRYRLRGCGGVPQAGPRPRHGDRACRRGETGRGFGPCRDAGVRAVESVRLLMDLDLHRAAGLVVGGLEGFPDPLQREAVGHHGIKDHSA